MTTPPEVDIRLSALEERNLRVEESKAWEISLFRKLVIAVFTYLLLGGYMYYLGVNQPWMNALVPTVGFILSTLSLPYFKQFWVKYIYNR